MPNPHCHCITIRRASKAVTDFYDEQLRACGVTINQYALLRSVERLENASVSDIARAMGLERSTVVRTVRPLLVSGLIEDDSASGARKCRLNLTPTGKNVLAAAGPLWDEAQRELERKLGKEQMASFYSLLAILNEM